jgi:hypothetical protein
MGSNPREFSNMDALTYAPNGRILVVDDNAHALQAIQSYLSLKDFLFSPHETAWTLSIRCGLLITFLWFCWISGCQ